MAATSVSGLRLIAMTVHTVLTEACSREDDRRRLDEGWPRIRLRPACRRCASALRHHLRCEGRRLPGYRGEFQFPPYCLPHRL